MIIFRTRNEKISNQSSQIVNIFWFNKVKAFKIRPLRKTFDSSRDHLIHFETYKNPLKSINGFYFFKTKNP
jgi:hypothetical protein